MKKENLVLILLVLLLVAAMIYTLVAGGNRSRHGYGDNDPVAYPLENTEDYGRPVNTG